jgi:hypothetical protein
MKHDVLYIQPSMNILNLKFNLVRFSFLHSSTVLQKTLMDPVNDGLDVEKFSSKDIPYRCDLLTCIQALARDAPYEISPTLLCSCSTD